MVSLLSSMPVIILPAINFLLLPLYLKLLDPSEFAVYNLLSNLSGLLAIVVGFRIGAAILPYFKEYNTNENTIYRFMVSIIKYILNFSIVAILIAAVAGPFIFKIIFKSEAFNFYPNGLMAVLTGIATALELAVIIFLRNQKNFFLLTKIQMIAVGVNVSLQLILLLFFSKSATSLLIARTIAAFILPAFFILKFLLPYWHFDIDKQALKKCLKFSMPLVIWLVISWITISFDRYYFEWILADNLKILGAYVLLLMIVAPISLIGDTVINNIQPYIYDHYSQPSERGYRLVNNYFTIYIYLLLLFSSFIILIATNLNLFTNKKEYLDIVMYIPLATLTHLFQGYSYVFRTTMIFNKASKKISVFSVYSLILLLILYFLLIPRFFIWGAIAALIIDGIFSSVGFYFLSAGDKTMRFNIKGIFGYPTFLWLILLFCFYYFRQFTFFNIVYWGILQLIIIATIFFIKLKQFNTVGKQDI